MPSPECPTREDDHNQHQWYDLRSLHLRQPDEAARVCPDDQRQPARNQQGDPNENHAAIAPCCALVFIIKARAAVFSRR
jgi:hypothetical protein